LKNAKLSKMVSGVQGDMERNGEDRLLDEVQQLCTIIGRSIVTAKANQQKAKGSPNSSRS
jgi:hypothetical protein